LALARDIWSAGPRLSGPTAFKLGSREPMQHIDEMTIPHTVTTVEGQPAVWIAGPNCVRQEVIGEEYNPEQMHRVVTGVQGRTDGG
jgi:hypothetical protein